jgi:hypothetical protein
MSPELALRNFAFFVLERHTHVFKLYDCLTAS